MVVLGKVPDEAEAVKVGELLKELRDNPISTNDPNCNAALTRCSTLLFGLHYPDLPPKAPHWYCEKTPAVAIEAATFCMRLHAYMRSDDWKTRLGAVLKGCVACVSGYAAAKVRSEETYLSYIKPATMKNFRESVDKWETTDVLSTLRRSNTAQENSLSFAPSAAVCHALTNLNLIQNTEIHALFLERPPTAVFEDWPEKPPPGLILVLASRNEALRQWAHAQASLCSPITSLPTSDPILRVVAVLVNRLQSVDPGSLTASHAQAGLIVPAIDTSHVLPPPLLWCSFPAIVRLVATKDRLSALKCLSGTDLIGFILGHLHDNDDHLPHVLNCFIILLSVYGPELWEGMPAEFPQVKIDALRDNPAYEALVRRNTQPTLLQWYEGYIRSVWKKPILPDAIAKMLAFMCEDMQHRHFDVPCRAVAMSVVSSTLRILYQDAQATKSEPHLAVLRHKVCTHAQVLAAVAFSREYKESAWAAARNEVRHLFSDILSSDAQRTGDLLARLSSIARAGDKAIKSDLGKIPFSIHDQLWKRMYDIFPSDDTEAMALLVHVTAVSAHLDVLKPEVYRIKAKGTAELKELKDAYAVEANAYHQALQTMRKGFDVAATAFAGNARKSVLMAFLNENEVAASLMAIMFSPAEALHNSAQELASQTYEVDGRDACFRAYFEHHPTLAFRGTFSFLVTVEGAVGSFLEACTVSRSTVLCLTDIIDVLCAKPDGLLFSTSYGGQQGLQLPDAVLELWNLMSNVIAAIFKQTPVWSSYIESSVMIVWMRDALIFARDMISQYSVFHSAASDTLRSSMVMASPRKASGTVSRTESMMMAKLDVVVEQTVRWLKLTDMELLHQSVELLKMILKCFEESTGLIKPPASVVERLNTYASGQSTSKLELTRDQLESLEDAIAPFLQDDRTLNEDSDHRSVARGPKTSNRTKRPPTPESSSSSSEDEESQDDIEYLGSSKAPVSRPVKKREANSNHSVLDQLMAASRNRVGDGAKSSKIQLNVTGASRKLEPTRMLSGPDGVKRGLMKTSGKHSSSSAKASGSKMQELREASRAQARQFGPPPAVSKGSAATGPKYEGPKAVGQKASSNKSASAPVSEASDDDDSGEEEEEGGLASLSEMQITAKVAKVVKVVAPLERRGIVLMDTNIRNPAKERMNAREQARRAQLRLKPDPTPLHRLILSWDFDHEGDEPPNFDAKNVRSIPDSFDSHEEYYKVMSPLLSLECWSQVVRAKEEVQEKTLWQIAQKQYVDSWLDIDITIVSPLPNKWYLAETDIVLLRPNTGGRGVLAKTQSFKSNARGVVASVRCVSPRVDVGLNAGTKWELSKVFSLSTVHREYAALMGLPYYDLFDSITRPLPAKLPEIPIERTKKVMQAYSVNEPQAAAIVGSLKTEGFALIQGPPGTGKTSTICGLAGEFLSTRSSNPVAIQAGKPTEKAPPRKLLVCAPSNAAIDEVAKRLRDGIRDSSGKTVIPKVVRIGNDASIHVSVKDIALDTLVTAKMNANGGKDKSSDASGEISNLRRELEEINRQRQEKLEALQAIQNNPTRTAGAETELKAINAKRSAVNQKLNQMRDQQTDNNRAMDAARRKFRQEVLWEADIICSTLSGSGHEILDQFDFETVVIDEAAQSIELSSLIPLKYQCKRCILVGDPQQLAPTVLSMKASQKNYQQSLFVRIQKHRPDAVHLLSIQYRMHPIISKLPSKIFYGGRLDDGPGMAEKTAQPWHSDLLLPPYRFFDVSQGLEVASNSHSMSNQVEAACAVALYNRLIRLFSPHGELDYRVGVISMYRGQLNELKNQFSKRFGRDILGKVDFNTVDGFQGQEKDVIILSCVRAGPGVNHVGFLADVRRMNVSITRSRSSLYILGHAATLERSDRVWKEIVQDARDRSCLTANVSPSTFTAPVRAPAVISTVKPKAIVTAKTVPLPPENMPLLTPKQLKENASREEAAKPRMSLNTTTALAQGNSTLVESSSDTTRPSPIRKRSITDDGPSRPPPALREEEGKDTVETAPLADANRAAPSAEIPKARHPVSSKPKAAPSLFIPKKPQKRKAPEGGAGPSDTKRRLAAEVRRPPPNP